MVGKLKAAVAARRDPSFVIIARTDARAVEGFDAAHRAGASLPGSRRRHDLSRGPRNAGRIRPIRAAVQAPLIANMTEFGKSPLLSAQELARLGYAAVLFPVTTLRVAMKAVESALGQIAKEGTQKGLLDRMQTRAELYDLLDYQGFEERDRSYFGG